MKKYLLIITSLLIIVCSSANATNTTTVDGKTYRCDNGCSADTSTTPATVTDCCGGEVWVKQEAVMD